MKLFSLLLLTFALFSCKPKVDYPKDNSTPRPTLEKDGWEITREFDSVNALSDYEQSSEEWKERTLPFIGEDGEVSSKEIVYSIDISYEGKPEKAALKLIEYVRQKVKEEAFHKLKGFYNHKKNGAPNAYLQQLEKLYQKALKNPKDFLQNEGQEISSEDEQKAGPRAWLHQYPNLHQDARRNQLFLWLYYFEPSKIPKSKPTKDNSTPRPTLEKDGWEIIKEFDPLKMLSDKNYYTKFFEYDPEAGHTYTKPDVDEETGEVDGGDVYSIEITYNGKPDEAAMKLIEYVRQKVKEEAFHKVEGFYNHKKNDAPSVYLELLEKLPQALLQNKEEFLSEEDALIDVNVPDDEPSAWLYKYTSKTPPTNQLLLRMWYHESIDL